MAVDDEFWNSDWIIIVEPFTFLKRIFQSTVNGGFLDNDKLWPLLKVDEFDDFDGVFRDVGLQFPQVVDQVGVYSWDEL